MPCDFLTELASVGIPTVVRDLRALGIASHFACVARSAVVPRVWHEFDQFQTSDKASLNPRRPWHLDSLSLSLRSFWAASEAERIRRSCRDGGPRHKQIYALARGEVGVWRHALTTVLLRRALRWSPYAEDIV